MTISNKSERRYRDKCLGWPVTSYGGGIPPKAILFFFGYFEVNSTWLITSEVANQHARNRRGEGPGDEVAKSTIHLCIY